MQNENSQQNSGKPNRRRTRPLPPLSETEFDFLKKKRFIEEWDVQRLFNMCKRTLYTRIKEGVFTPSLIGSKKLFDFEDIYKMIEEKKGRKK